MSHERKAEHVDFEHLSAGRARSIDAVCDCFEHQLRTGSGPTIESLIAGFVEPDRTILLRELLALEVETCLARHETIIYSEYFRRFPLYGSVVTEVLAEFRPAANADVPASTERLPVIPKYHLLRRISEGGMGAVYEAMHTDLGNLVAIKVLRPNCAANSTAEIGFWREMKVIGTLTHPNIVQARDGGTAAGGMQYLVMEYLVGVDLSQLVRRVPRIPVADACEIAYRVALALEYARQHQLVHRDIKPQNVLLGRSYGAQGEAQVKVVDFGLALLRGDVRGAEGGAGEVVGTFTFMAPEQYWEQSSDIRSDLYSLGCTLFFLLTGRAPFPRSAYATTAQLMMAHRQTPPPALMDLRPDVDDDLVTLLNDLLAKLPSQRPATPQLVAERLKPLAVGNDLNALLHRAEHPSSASLPEPPAPIGPIEPLIGDSGVSATGTWIHSFGEGQIPTSTPASTVPPDDDAPRAETGKGALAVEAGPATAIQRSRRGILGLAVSAAAVVLGVGWWYWFSPAARHAPRDLLAAIDVQRDAIGEPWRRSRVAVSSPDAPYARLVLRGEVPTAYRLEIDARRQSGSRLVIGLVRRGESFPVVLDAARLAGGIGDDTDTVNAARQLADEMGIRPGPAKMFVCHVDVRGVVVAYEDRILFALEGAAPLPASEEWNIAGHGGLFVGSHHSVYDFHRVTLYPGRP